MINVPYFRNKILLSDPVFCQDLTPKATEKLTGISRRTVVSIFGKLRGKIARCSEQQAAIAKTIEVDNL